MKKIIVSPVDNRDYQYTDQIQSLLAELPLKYKSKLTKVRCQGFSSQCVAFACTQAVSQYEYRQANKYNIYSPGLLYSNREKDDYQGEGGFVRKALKQLYNYGVCLETDFPFPESYKREREKFLKNKDKLLNMAAAHKIKKYFRCNTEQEIKNCIMLNGSVIVSTNIPTKGFGKHKLIAADYIENKGGHAFILIGGDEDGGIAQDSYSILRPIFGRFHISYDYPIAEFGGIEI